MARTEPIWSVSSLAFIICQGSNFSFDLASPLGHVAWRIAGQINAARRLGTFFPWGLLSAILYAAGVWIIFQPMEMRGMMMH
jgi:hypothetical protein